MLTLIDTLTENPYLNDNTTISTTLSTLNATLNIMDVLVSSNTTNSTTLATALNEASNIISNSLNQIQKLDCGLSSNFSGQALNSSFELLQQLSEISLKGANSTNATSIFSTTAFLMFSGIFNSSQLNDMTINASDNSPQLQLGSIQDIQNLPSYVAMTYIYLKQDPTSCQDTPATNFSIQFQDARTWQPVTISTSVQVIYPASIFKNIKCDGGCPQSFDLGGNVKCVCLDIGFFDIKNQLGRMYQNSNFRLVTLSSIAGVF